eukprot:Opistho-2@82996
MKPALSLYLDTLRFGAALTVFLSHFGLQRLSGGLFWFMANYGPQAVTVFFVLSGFVIAYTTDTREKTAAANYCISRAARMYSVALPAVLLTVLLDAIGSRLRPEEYSSAWGFVEDLSFLRFFAALTFTNELWTLSVHQGSNAAYWSMGYEVPYYVIFGLALYTPRRWRVLAVGGALLAAGPAIVLSMPIWLAGVAAYHYCKSDRVPVRTGLLLFFGSILAWIVYETLALRYGRPTITPGPFIKRAEVLQDLIVGSLFVAHLIGYNAAAAVLGRYLQRFAGAIRWLAGASFTLYLCHLPIAQFLLACLPWSVSDPRSRTVVFFPCTLR